MAAWGGTALCIDSCVPSAAAGEDWRLTHAMVFIIVYFD
jgi:hypothetical protein